MRIMLLGPSSSGKSSCMVDMILRLLRGSDGKSCFNRIYIASPSLWIDSVWVPVAEMIRDELGVEDPDEWGRDHWDPEWLASIIQQQQEVVKHLKQSGQKRMFQSLLVIDDFADSPEICHSNNGRQSILPTLFMRGRHGFQSVVCSSQRYMACSTSIRANLQALCVWRLRNGKELNSLMTELSAIVPEETLMQMYEESVREPYGFWYINLTAPTIKDMFFKNFTHRFVIQDTE